MLRFGLVFALFRQRMELESYQALSLAFERDVVSVGLEDSRSRNSASLPVI